MRKHFVDFACDVFEVGAEDGEELARLSITSPGGGPKGEDIALSFHLSVPQALETMAILGAWVLVRLPLMRKAARAARRRKAS